MSSQVEDGAEPQNKSKMLLNAEWKKQVQKEENISTLDNAQFE